MVWERPLSRVEHGTPPIRRLCADRGARRGGSLPSYMQLLDWHAVTSEETGNHSGEKKMGARNRGTRSGDAVEHGGGRPCSRGKRGLERSGGMGNQAA